MNWKEGDVVRLKSGGPAMTVERVKDKQGIKSIRCSWFDGSKKMDALFHPDALMAVDFRPPVAVVAAPES